MIQVQDRNVVKVHNRKVIMTYRSSADWFTRNVIRPTLITYDLTLIRYNIHHARSSKLPTLQVN